MMQPTKQVLALVPLIIACAILFLLWRGLHIDPSKVPSPLINKPVPSFSLNSLDADEKITEKIFQGKVTLFNVWATWCYACAVEHDFLVQLSANTNLQIIGLDYKDAPSKATKWLAQYGNPYKLILLDPDGNAAIDWGVYGTPETFIIDKHGVIRYKQIGPINANVWNSTLAPIIKQLESEQ